MTEGVETVIPKSPQDRYRVDGKTVTDWKMVLISTTEDESFMDMFL